MRRRDHQDILITFLSPQTDPSLYHKYVLSQTKQCVCVFEAAVSVDAGKGNTGL